MTRFYNEVKAKRVNIYQHYLQEKLYKSIKNRTAKELAMKAEIDEIAGAYVNLKCVSCRKGIQIKFKDWQTGKFKRICTTCTKNKIHAVLDDLHKKISPLLPEDYEIRYDSYYNATQCLAIRKKKE